MNYLGKVSEILEKGFQSVEILKIFDDGDTIKREYHEKSIRNTMEILAEVANISRVINTPQGLLTLEEADLLEEDDQIVIKWSNKIDGLLWLTRVTIYK